MNDEYDDLHDDRMAYLAEVRQQRQQLARLLRNPGCQDPDHPGCAACDEDDTP